MLIKSKLPSRSLTLTPRSTLSSSTFSVVSWSVMLLPKVSLRLLKWLTLNFHWLLDWLEPTLIKETNCWTTSQPRTKTLEFWSLIIWTMQQLRPSAPYIDFIICSIDFRTLFILFFWWFWIYRVNNLYFDQFYHVLTKYEGTSKKLTDLWN